MQSPSLFLSLSLYIYIVFPSTIKKDRYPNAVSLDGGRRAAPPRFLYPTSVSRRNSYDRLSRLNPVVPGFLRNLSPSPHPPPFPFEGLRVAVKKEKGKRRVGEKKRKEKRERKERHGKIKWPSLPSSWRPIRRSTIREIPSTSPFPPPAAERLTEINGEMLAPR